MMQVLSADKIRMYLDYFAKYDSMQATVMRMRIKSGDLVPVDDNGNPVKIEVE